MKTVWHKSIGKIEIPPTTNEDYAISNKKKGIIAVSDGAGGGGIYAEKWSQYLCSNIPSTPIGDFDELNVWIDSIWEDFYNEYEELAKNQGGLFLQKFYDEGSYATIVCSWINKETVTWLSYGDSTMFLYRPSTKELLSSIVELSQYNNPPYLIGTINQLKPEGFNTGCWKIQSGDIIFCASDALSHYILMCYQITHADRYSTSIEDAMSCKSKNSNCISAKLALGEDDFSFELEQLLEKSHKKNDFTNYMKKLYKNGVIALDDYSISFWIV